MTVYLEARFNTGEDLILADVLTALLAEIGFESFTQEAEIFSAFIPEDLFHQSLLDEVLLTLPSAVPPQLVTHQPENWNTLWESQFEPIRINDNCWIRAPFHPDIPEASLQLVIEPKMSFGTGHHATTRLMCLQMLELDFKGKQVWDYGCGTGILGILAHKLGASKVIANDIESWAVENSVENAQRNASSLQLYTGTAEQMPPGNTFDIILANINRNILVETVAHYLPHLKQPGFLLISGFLEPDEEVLNNLYTQQGLTQISTLHEDGWSCLLFEKPKA